MPQPTVVIHHTFDIFEMKISRGGVWEFSRKIGVREVLQANFGIFLTKFHRKKVSQICSKFAILNTRENLVCPDKWKKYSKMLKIAK